MRATRTPPHPWPHEVPPEEPHPSQFYNDYDRQLVPEKKFLTNVITQKYKIPQDRADEAISFIIANAEFAGILRETQDGKRRLDLESTAAADSTAKDAGVENGGLHGHPT